MPDLPADLTAQVIRWIACDECGGTGCTRNVGGHTGEDLSRCRWLCPRRHVVVTHQGRSIHADPERVTRWCAAHGRPYGDHPARDDNGVPLGCTPVLRPLIDLDLGVSA